MSESNASEAIVASAESSFPAEEESSDSFDRAVVMAASSTASSASVEAAAASAAACISSLASPRERLRSSSRVMRRVLPIRIVCVMVN